MNLLNKEFAIKNKLIESNLFDLPERVIQFGTGILLRGLVDYVIDKANKKNNFNGRVVVIKTTHSDASDFDKQNGIFTHTEQGIENGEVFKKTTINTSISRVVNANDNWKGVLELVENLNLDIIVSNTTEAGLKYVDGDNFYATPPQSFPLKLMALLFERYKFVAGIGNGFIIIPTELLVGNGTLLKKFVVQHAQRNNLPEGFINWLNTECRFCNSLVDRIVTGAPHKTEKENLEMTNGYEDNLIINSESFLLWAIEGDAFLQNILSFAETDTRIIISPNIENFREQKLRILNGCHTISVPLAFLKGLGTVGEMMNDATIRVLVEDVLKNEIAPTLNFDTNEFTQSVLDRFRNPFIEHKLISIMFECSAKMNARNVITIIRYFEKFGKLPKLMIKGFAAYLLFTKPVKQEGGKYFGQKSSGEYYLIHDAFAPFFEIAWKETNVNDLSSLKKFVQTVLNNNLIFDDKLKQLTAISDGLSIAISELLSELSY